MCCAGLALRKLDSARTGPDQPRARSAPPRESAGSRLGVVADPVPAPLHPGPPRPGPRDRHLTRENVCQRYVLAGQVTISAVTRRSRGPATPPARRGSTSRPPPVRSTRASAPAPGRGSGGKDGGAARPTPSRFSTMRERRLVAGDVGYRDVVFGSGVRKFTPGGPRWSAIFPPTASRNSCSLDPVPPSFNLVEELTRSFQIAFDDTCVHDLDDLPHDP